MLSALLVFSACQDFEPLGEETLSKLEYARNFEQMYGSIDPNQSWDLTVDNFGNAKERSGAQPEFDPSIYKPATEAQYNRLVSTGDWYNVQQNTIKYIKQYLREEEQALIDKDDAFDFVMQTKDMTDFAIIPIYQGKAGMDWELHLVANNIDYRVWGQSEGMEIKKTEGSNWVEPGTHLDDNSGGESSTIDAFATRSKPIIINGSVIDGEFELYLKITDGQTTWKPNKDGHANGDYAVDNTGQRSDYGMMIPLDFYSNYARGTVGGIPSNLGTVKGFSDASDAILLGCEDANLDNSDWDFNDVVFLIVGVEAKRPVVKEIVDKKRYLMEDLGDLEDADFNDVVVDMYKYREVSDIHIVGQQGSGVIQKRNSPYETESAKIVHLGGIYPFEVCFGDYLTDSSIKSSGRIDPSIYGSVAPLPSADVSIEIFNDSRTSYWNPETNNIYLKVYNRYNKATGEVEAVSMLGQPVCTIGFPEKNHAPMIIAADPGCKWMPERVHITRALVEQWATGGFNGEQKPGDGKPDTPIKDVDLDFVDGVATLWEGREWAGNYSQFNKTSTNGEGDEEAYAKIVKAVKNPDVKYITLFLDNKINGNYTIRDDKWDELASGNGNNKNYITIELTDDMRNHISKDGGMRLEFWVSGANITKVVASEEAVAGKLYTITVNSNGNGYVTGGTKAEAGSSITISAIPNEGYKFTQWSDGNKDATRTITVTADATYTATFAMAQKYQITVLAGPGGSSTGTNSYYEGQTVTITATPSRGYKFVKWNDGSTENPRTITVKGNATYKAVFEEGSEKTVWTGNITNHGWYDGLKFSELEKAYNEGMHTIEYVYTATRDGNIEMCTGWNTSVINTKVKAGTTSVSVTLTADNINLMKQQSSMTILKVSQNVTLTAIKMK